MCKECRQSVEGQAIWEEYKAAQSAAMALTGGNPNVAAFLHRHDAKKVVNEKPTDQPVFTGGRAAVLERYNKAKAALDTHHEDFVMSGLKEAISRGGKLTIFVCKRGPE